MRPTQIHIPDETLRRRRGHRFYPTLAAIRQTPALRATEGISVADKFLTVHYFTPSSDWWVAELDTSTWQAFGYVCLNGDVDNAEWGYFDLRELEQAYPSPYVVVERDCHWTPVTVRQAKLPGRNATGSGRG